MVFNIKENFLPKVLIKLKNFYENHTNSSLYVLMKSKLSVLRV
jgi:hypothetical protein